MVAYRTKGGDTKCSICGDTLSGYGNNADPVNDGRCCSDCDIVYVLPARIAEERSENERGQRGERRTTIH
jgi:hypothetical protein